MCNFTLANYFLLMDLILEPTRETDSDLELKFQC